MLYHFRVIWRWIIVTFKWVCWSLKVIQTGTIRKLGCGFLFAFHSNNGSIWHHFPVKARYWSKIVIFSYLLAFAAHVLGVPSEYCHTVWCEKLACSGYPMVKKTLMICLAVLREYRQVTDGQTDGRTGILPRRSLRYAYVSRGKTISVSVWGYTLTLVMGHGYFDPQIRHCVSPTRFGA